jgi:5-methylcytosine-specific restriction endonuclease McrA
VVDKGLGPKIRSLREAGMSYTEIQRTLGCSKGSISYHLGVGQKEKTKARQRSNRASRAGAVRHKLSGFMSSPPLKPPRAVGQKSAPRAYSDKIGNFSRLDGVRDTYDITYEEVLDRLEADPVCYLTGDPIDPDVPASFEFDHIHPRSRGGLNVIENLGFTTREANRAKGNMTLEEFVTLCRKVVKNFDNVDVA